MQKTTTLKTEVFTNWNGEKYQKATLKNYNGIHFVGIATTVQDAISLSFIKARAFTNSLKAR